MSAVLAVAAAGTTLGSCSSDGEKPQQEGMTKNQALDAVRARLAEQRKPLGGNAPRVYQQLTDDMAAATDAGASPEEINAEVLASQYLQWTRRGGTEAFLANNESLANGHSTLTAPAPPKEEGGKPEGNGPLAGVEDRSDNQNPPVVMGSFTNGVLNNSGPDMSEALTNLGATLGRNLTGAYNPSFVDPKTSAQLGQAGAMAAKDKGMDPDVKPLVDSLAGPFALLPGMTNIVANEDAYINKLPGLIGRWENPEAAKSNNAYQVMVKWARPELEKGNKVVLVGHSDGSFMVRAAKQTLDQEFGVGPGRPSSVGTLYIAPPFKDEDSKALNSGDSRYVLLQGDVLSKLDISRVEPNVQPSGGQPSDITGTDTHLLNNYLLKGSQSRQDIIDAYQGLSSHLCRPGAGQGRGRQQPSCDELPTPGKTESPTPGRTPGGTPEGTPSRPGEPTDGQTGRTTPQSPGGGTPEGTPSRPSQPGRPTGEETGGTPEPPPSHTPQQPQPQPGPPRPSSAGRQAMIVG